MRWLVLALALPACAGYQPGSFVDRGQPMPPARAQLDCVDVAIERQSAAVRPVFHFVIANGCDGARVIDFARVRLTTERGRMGPLDPRREIAPATLEARTIARIDVRFAIDDDATALCFDLADLVTGDEPTADRTLCVDDTRVAAGTP